MLRDVHFGGQLQWLQQQQEVINQWQQKVQQQQSQTFKMKDKDKEASMAAVLNELPAVLPPPEPPQTGLALSLGGIVRRKLQNGSSVWEYWTDPKVDTSTAVNHVRALMQ
eukprot:NODE_1071_length_502_cov_127.538667_g1061_i0.p1 GENE.NODE_1071_length_502_cov_127.538667_g1061_i0~~NODE_1071_length_502_cov_127.538667_g1061_i0.p1  ORF type:complete len:121 (+),score=54.98 NODE_1071_length_502_cov_127.538667_g1061_i0:36-365(+)